jgi:hypothetical protein
MATLNEIAENIAYKLGDQFNTTLQESIKDSVLNYRAKFIRDDLDRNFLSDIHFSQTGTIQFKLINLLTEFGADYSAITSICPDILDQDKYKILKSINPIPTPIRLKSAGNSLYNFIGSTDGRKRFILTTLDKFYYYKHLPYNTHTIYYIVLNKHLYIINNLQECDINDTLKILNVLIKGVFENPADFYNACIDGDNFADDIDFPIGRDMLMQISNNILKSEYPVLPKDGQTVNIKPDDND